MCFSIDSRHFYRYQLCSPSCRFVFDEADFIQRLLKKNVEKFTRSFNFTFRYIDYVLSLNNAKLGDFVDRFYLIEFEIMDATYTARYASYLDLHIEIDNGAW